MEENKIVTILLTKIFEQHIIHVETYERGEEMYHDGYEHDDSK
jgi:hypothetical protein